MLGEFLQVKSKIRVQRRIKIELIWTEKGTGLGKKKK